MSDETGMSLEIRELFSAQITVSERHPAPKLAGCYQTEELAKTQNEAELTFGWSNCDYYVSEDRLNLVNFQFSSHHIENCESGRGFHVVAEANLGWPEVIRLHRFLKMLIDANGEGLLEGQRNA